MTELKLKYWKPTNTNGVVKLTVHKSTGNMGFSTCAIKELGLDNKSFVKIGMNPQDSNDDNLYLMITDKDDPYAFKVCKAGNYYYINTKRVLDRMGFDYKSNKIIYDIIEFEDKIYKLFKRVLERVEV